MITTYRSPGGAGVRLDGGTTYTGAEITAHFDSMLAKLTCRGRTFEDAVAKARRAVAEFRIRGVSTNIPFLQAVLDDPDFRAGRVTTRFIETHPQLLKARASGDRGTKLLTYLADVTVNQPHGAAPVTARPGHQAARPRPRRARARRHPAAAARARPGGVRAPAARAERRRGHRHHVPRRPPVAARDPGAHPRPARRRRRTSPARTPQLWSLECWGGATYDVALRFLSEDPWERLAALREAVPNICLQMLLRGRNTVGYTPYPTEVTDAFVEEAADDRDRRLPDLRRAQRRRADAAGDRGGPRDRDRGRRGRALLHRRPLQPRREALHARLLPAAGRADRRRRRARAGDQGHGRAAARAGRAHAGHRAARAVRPAGAPAHPRHRGRPARHAARRDRRRCRRGRRGRAPRWPAPRRSRRCRRWSRATDHTERETGLSLAAVNALEPYWEAVRRVYAPFESGLPAPTGRVYRHEIPGGQLSNLRQQAIALGLGEKFEQIEDMYAAANDILGHIPKVTPSSKVVGDLALHLVGARRRPGRVRREPGRFDIPDSVIGFLNGELGDPPGGWPEPFRTKALEGRSWKPPASELTAEQRERLAEGSSRTRRATLNELLFPGPTKEFLEARETYGDVSVLPTIDYLYGLRHGEEHEVALEEGKTLILGLQAISEPDERGFRTVMATINGQLRPVSVRDRGVAADVAAAEKADPAKPGHVAAPFQGVVTLGRRRGRQGRGRRDGRHHRGDEDGGLDHRPGRRHRRAARALRHPGRRRRRPGAASCPSVLAPAHQLLSSGPAG